MTTNYDMSILCSDGSVFVNAFNFYDFIKDSKTQISFNSKQACWQVNMSKEELLNNTNKYKMKNNVNNVVNSIIEDDND